MCPICGGSERSLVCEYNRFVLFEELPAGAQERYDYALCHLCGLVYATRRLEGATYADLLVNFDDGLGRAAGDNPVLQTGRLSDEDRAELRRRVAGGTFVSADARKPKQDFIPGLMSDRLSNAAHLEILLSLLEPTDINRVVEIRSRTGYLLDSLRRWFGAEVHAMPMFESQAEIAASAYGIPTTELIDFENFEIPVDDQQDLIIAKHMFTHASDPGAFLDEVRRKLHGSGWLYLYSEPDDVGRFERGKSLFSVLNAFHVQTFDRHAFTRALRARGFEPVFITWVDQTLACLARVDPDAGMTPLKPNVRDARLEYYSRWRDFSVASAPVHAQQRFASELTAIEQRIREGDWATIDKKGRPRLVGAGSRGKEATA